MMIGIRLASLACMLVAVSLVAGCNTTRGMGEDVEATGEAVQNAAQNTEERLEN